jgi:cystathionine beta-lyase
MSREVGKSTRLVEGGRRKEWRRRLVNVPVERASTILFDRVDDLHASKPGIASYRYGLQGTATHWALAEALTKLEPGAAGTILYPSGLAAITVPLLALLSPGDELLVPDSVYGPTRKFCDTILKRLMIATRYYDRRSDPRDPARKPRFIDHGDPGRACDLRRRTRARHCHLARQHLGHPDAFPCAGSRG